MAAPPPSPDDVGLLSSISRDWGTTAGWVIGGFVATLGSLWRWFKYQFDKRDDQVARVIQGQGKRIDALEVGQKLLESGHIELRIKIERLPTREEQADQFDRLNRRLDGIRSPNPTRE